jgi:NADH dehydrogenase (ubiquinone) Fe-S protein 1
MIEIIINNNKYTFEKPLTVLQACEQANITVPRFCYHEKLSVAGNCRMCLVEIEKSPKPIASCAMPIAPGMVVFTETPLVKKAREAILEFLLINHPLDCPICDQGGECDLQDITLNYGSDRSRFFDFKRGVEDKECGPIVKTIMTRCIHCTRCVRFLTEVAGLEVFGALGRGELMEIGTYLNKYLHTELSGNLVDLCPVGALTSKPYAFLARNWELKKFESVDFSDSFGSNIVIHTRNFLNSKNLKNVKTPQKDQILRILPKLNNELNESWISDKTRYSFDGVIFNRFNSLEHTDLFLSKKQTFLTWNTFFLNFSLEKFKNCLKTFNLFGSVGTTSSVEEIYFFYNFLKHFGSSNIALNNNFFQPNFDLPAFYQFNSKFNAIEASDLILLIGINPRFESSMLNLKIRKQFFNKEVAIYNVGANFSLTYPTIHLGNSSKILLQIAEGKHSFCKNIRNANKPLVICGTDLWERCDNKVLQNLTRFLSKKSFLNLKTGIFLNTSHQNVSQIQLCELGLGLNSTNFLYKNLIQKNLAFASQSNNNFLIANNVDFVKFPKTTTLFSLNTHNTVNGMNSEFKMPVNTLYEREGLLINSEGRIQKNFKSITPLSNGRNSEDFFKSLIKLEGTKNYLTFTNKWLFVEAPFLKQLNKPRKTFYFNFLQYTEFQSKVVFSPIKSTLINFYMTNNLSSNSKIMAECSLFFKMNSNF